LKPGDKVFYLRALIGFAVGFLSALLSGLRTVPFPLTWASAIIVASAIYYATYRAFRKAFSGKMKKRDIAVTGIEAYIFLWLFSWTFFYTVWPYWFP